MEDGSCFFCGVPEGSFHDDLCDLERCPICGGQFSYCDCPEEEKFKKRIRHIGFLEDNVCAYCGKRWPQFFIDEEWQEIMPEIYQDKILCYDCWVRIRRLLGHGGTPEKPVIVTWPAKIDS